ncbi:hypothetical protein [Actinokineospora iranica]|uniref:Uncharacterized protein n=1 Tax=Actinokineospora iranica TaxID=1271860 RepID=A0A1G6Y8K2_9PSEU|nr:hypothetical protein [Actinokineospora iranica]SDD86591.1 hypothetical protein SAMN05216174_12082 [Actinokineospora iranica]
MTAYRNTRTGEVHRPEPGSWMAERLDALPGIWHPVEVADGAAQPAARPSRTARKAEWVDHAMSRGYPRADAESLSRDDLARLFDDDQD